MVFESQETLKCTFGLSGCRVKPPADLKEGWGPKGGDPKLSSILRKSSDMHKPIQRVESRKLLHATLKFEIKILRLEWFDQVNLISAAPKLQKFEDRSSGKSKVPAKQRGSWPKVC